jgi:hypothetical protein
MAKDQEEFRESTSIRVLCAYLMYYLIIPKCKWCNAEGYLILPYCSSKINCCSSLWLAAAVAVKSAVDQKKANRARRKQLDEQSRLKERKTLQKKGLSQYDRNQLYDVL